MRGSHSNGVVSAHKDNSPGSTGRLPSRPHTCCACSLATICSTRSRITRTISKTHTVEQYHLSAPERVSMKRSGREVCRGGASSKGPASAESKGCWKNGRKVRQTKPIPSASDIQAPARKGPCECNLQFSQPSVSTLHCE